MYARLLEKIETDTLIFIPMIDGINITTKQVEKYENPDYVVPNKDQITPIIMKSIKTQNVDFFTDPRSYNERNSV